MQTLERTGSWVVISPEPAEGPPAPPARRRRRDFPALALSVVVIAGLLGGAAASLLGVVAPGDVPPPITVAPAAVAPAAVAPAAVAPAAVAPAGTVRVVDQGFTNVDGEPATLGYAVLVRNTARELAALDVRVVIRFTDAAGEVAGTRQVWLGAVMPGRLGAVAGNPALAGVAGMRTRLTVGRWARTTGQDGTLEARGVSFDRTGGAVVTTAEVTSTLGAGVTSADVTAVHYDREGRITGGAGTRAELAGGSATVEIMRRRTPPGVARAEVYVTPAG